MWSPDARKLYYVTEQGGKSGCANIVCQNLTTGQTADGKPVRITRHEEDTVRRARISGNGALPGQRATVTALAPLAEITDYQSRLKALTGGEGSYTMDLSHYDPVPAHLVEKIVADRRRPELT